MGEPVRGPWNTLAARTAGRTSGRGAHAACSRTRLQAEGTA
jgi:hypothetical protein